MYLALESRYFNRYMRTYCIKNPCLWFEKDTLWQYNLSLLKYVYLIQSKLYLWSFSIR